MKDDSVQRPAWRCNGDEDGARNKEEMETIATTETEIKRETETTATTESEMTDDSINQL